MTERITQLDAGRAVSPPPADMTARPRGASAGRLAARRDYRMRRLLLAGDMVAIAAALIVSELLLWPEAGMPELAWGLATLPCWAVIFTLYGLYGRDVKRISHTTVDDLPWVFHAVLIGVLLLWLLYRVAPVTDVKAVPILGFGIAALVTVPLARSLTRRATTKILGRERVLLIGDGGAIPALVRKMRAHPEYGLEPVGVVSAGVHDGDGVPKTVGSLDELELAETVAAHRVDRVVVSHQSLEERALVDLVRRCRELNLKLSLLPQLSDMLGPSIEVDDVEGITVLGVNPPTLSRSSRMLKRTMDLVGASVLLLASAPLMALAAVAIKVDSSGPVFFSQERIGRLGRRFRVVKFRTMVADAENLRARLVEDSRDPGWLLLDHDPRITRVGRLLRLTSLDELPQLWNVFRGEMSLVGPRPLIEDEHSQLTGWSRTRIDLTPGLTGLWQVLGRTRIPFEEMVKLDYLYVTNWSLWTDIRLLLRTLPAVLSRRGAN